MKVTVWVGEGLVDGKVTVAVKVTVCVATLVGEEDAILIVGVADATVTLSDMFVALKLESLP